MRIPLTALLFVLRVMAAVAEGVPATGHYRLALYGPQSVSLVEPARPSVPRISLPLRLPQGNITAVASSARSIFVAFAERARARSPVFRFDLETGRTTELSVGDAENLSVTPDGRRLAALSAFTRIQGSGVHDIAVFDLDPLSELGTVPGGAGFQAEMSWHPDGRRLAFSDLGGWVSEFDLDSRSLRRLVAGHSPAWSPSGRRLAVRRGERTILVREADGSMHKTVARWFFRAPFVGPMEWSPDGRWLAVTSIVGMLVEKVACDVLAAEDGTEVASYPDVWCGGWLQPQ